MNKTKLILFFVFFLIITSSYAQRNTSWLNQDTTRIIINDPSCSGSSIYISKDRRLFMNYDSTRKEILVVKIIGNYVGNLRFNADISYVTSIHFVEYRNGMYIRIIYREIPEMLFFMELPFHFNVVNR